MNTKKHINLDMVKAAYLMLKNYFYHYDTDLFVKEKIAKYEEFHNYVADNIFNSLYEEITYLLGNKTIFKNIKVDFRFIPKGVNDENNEEQASFLSNVKEQQEYKLKVNYFIDVDIPIRVLDVLWTMTKGKEIDKALGEYVYAGRLSEFSLKASIKNVLFKKYFEQYSSWRDNAINTAKKLIKGNKNVIILSTDLESFFYSIDIDFSNKELQDDYGIYKILSYIHTEYFNKIKNYLELTHKSKFRQKILPIGLLSSYVLANWYLKDFDKEIFEKANPIYYGRYVDDILIVTHTNQKNINEKQECIKQCFNGVVDFDKKNIEQIKYSRGNINIFFKEEKTIVHFLNSKNSIASLKIFETEIQKNTSMFRFLPTEEATNTIDDVAYDLFYYGSKNKFRSIVNFKENATRFSTYLSTQIILNRLTDMKNSPKVQKDIAKFFRGKNYLAFSGLWLKYLYFLQIMNDTKNINIFIKNVKNIIKKSNVYIDKAKNIIKASNAFNDAENHLRKDLNDMLVISMNLSSSVNIDNLYRNSNMIDNSYVAFPLVNFTDYKGSLCNIDLDDIGKSKELKEDKLFLSPRFIHFDEFHSFYINKNIRTNNKITFNDISKKYYHFFNIDMKEGNITVSNLEDSKNINITNIEVKDFDKEEEIDNNRFANKIKIALVNTNVPEKQIKKSYENFGKKTVVSLSRELNLFNVLNMAEKEKVSMLIFPELSIPYRWLPHMFQFSRRHQISLIFGLEYILSNKEAYNYVVTTLPFKKGKYNTLLPIIRLKNHYSPEEIKELEKNNYKIPSQNTTYNLFNWNGLQFTTFICYELADILHRSMFKMNVDLLTSCVWNKDINYYNNMLSSTVRDLHCYLAQCNTSQYGDSCIIQPTKTEDCTIAKIKGGNNSSIITAKLNINKLRNFHSLKSPNDDETFKPVPPGNNFKFDKKHNQ